MLSGYDVTIASPGGGAVPVDPVSLEGDALTDDARKFQEDGEKLVLQHSCECVGG